MLPDVGNHLVHRRAGTEYLGDELTELGVAEIFGPGASMDEMIAYIREHAPER